jgi:hypothetical protein
VRLRLRGEKDKLEVVVDLANKSFDVRAVAKRA